MNDLKSRVEIISSPFENTPTHGFKSAGEFFTSVINYGVGGAVRKDYRLQAAVQNDNTIREQADAAKMMPRAYAKAAGMNITTLPDGGFLVPEAFSTELMQSLYDSAKVYGRCLHLATDQEKARFPVTTETSRVDGSRQGGIQSFWLGEAEEYTGSKPALGELLLQPTKLYGYTSVTYEMVKFATPGVEEIIKRMFIAEFGFKLDSAIIRGTGAGQPLGILNAPALIVVAKESGQVAKTIQTENLLKMMARLTAESFTNAAWFINQDTLIQLMAVTTGIGPSGLFNFADGKMTLLGLPIIITEQCSTLGTVGDIILADLSQYILCHDAAGVEGVVSIHVRFDYGESRLRWTMYVDGQPWTQVPITPYQGTDTQSPFIALATRA